MVAVKRGGPSGGSEALLDPIVERMIRSETGEKLVQKMQHGVGSNPYAVAGAMGRLRRRICLCRATGAALARAAQPRTGVTARRSSADERLLDLYRCHARACDPAEIAAADLVRPLLILDCRALLNVRANTIKGKGIEDTRACVRSSRFSRPRSRTRVSERARAFFARARARAGTPTAPSSTPTSATST